MPEAIEGYEDELAKEEGAEELFNEAEEKLGDVTYGIDFRQSYTIGTITTFVEYLRIVAVGYVLVSWSDTP
jgi:hypothetical protein